jgi:enoyl-CoA hydratase/carnithine racemase
VIGAESKTYEHILVEADGPVARVTMNRPDKRNALSLAHMRELADCLRAIGEAREAHVVVLAGNGPAFCAGHDLSEMVGRDPEAYRRIFDVCCELMETVQAIPQPVIGQVHGVATAAGCQLAATCDLVVASEEARFATPGVRIGLFCSTPMVALSRNVAPKHAMEMLLTGDMISADAAVRIGLVNRSVDPAGLEAATMELAHRIAAKSAHVVKIGKEAFYRQSEMTLAHAYAYATEVMVENMLARDAEEGIAAFIEKRSARWENR